MARSSASPCPPGSLIAGGDAFTFTDNNADVTGGVFKVKLAERDDSPGAFRLDIQGYSANLQPDTTIPMDTPDMTAEFAIGGQSWTTGVKTWDRKAFGWQLNLVRRLPAVRARLTYQPR